MAAEKSKKNLDNYEYDIRVKSVQIRSFFWSVFSCIRTNYGNLRSKSGRFGRFSRSVIRPIFKVV